MGLESGRALRTLAGHTGPVTDVAVSGDGRIAVSASNDRALKVWQLETGTCLATFTLDSAADCRALSDARKLIVAGDVAATTTSSVSKNRSPNSDALSR